MQDAAFGGRRVYGDLNPPDFAQLAQCVGAAYLRVATTGAFAPAPGLRLVEVDMRAIGEAPPYYPFLPKQPARLSK